MGYTTLVLSPSFVMCLCSSLFSYFLFVFILFAPILVCLSIIIIIIIIPRIPCGKQDVYNYHVRAHGNCWFRAEEVRHALRARS